MEQGTWLGVTKKGSIAALTNFQEEGQVIQEARSRGAMVNAFLMQSPEDAQGTEAFVNTLVDGDGLKGVGGFSLVCGKIGQPLAVISNRTPNAEGVAWLAKERNETIGLSNAAFNDRTWPKVLQGEELLSSAIAASVARGDGNVDLVEELMRLLSTDTLPKKQEGQGWENYVRELRKSIFVPVVGGEGTDDLQAGDMAAAKSDQHVRGLSGLYGTQTQTVVLLDHHGQVTFVERTLYDNNAKPVKNQDRDRWFEFHLGDES